ncbi:hypothetical protein [Teredinibacter sp. KSP-S5-2]|uniref:hypothetical protein n=1 Tax=Teredinibacter sp. KSP-S5-2 TaxID=3034506 RepID=UPI002934A96C|nr:hypothetical protein [Teredinibacter sp. KSP-S5-2]WNO10797.1 hypothetical protein P5V12_06365 [Teredinibacter sp. KSP-S5-2]
MEFLIYFLLDAIISGSVLWVASRITSVDLLFKTAVIVSGCSALVGLIPGVGWILSIVVFFYLLKKYTGASVWPDLILMVLVSKLVAIVAVMAVAGSL